jgi:hypothetical protein
MTADRLSRAKGLGRLWPVLRRAINAATWTLWHVYHEQVMMWECWLRVSRAPMDLDGPLAWQPSLDGPRLIGRHLPAPCNANPGGTR